MWDNDVGSRGRLLVSAYQLLNFSNYNYRFPLVLPFQNLKSATLDLKARRPCLIMR